MGKIFNILSISILLCVIAHAESKVIKDSQGMDCYVYLPEKIDPAITYQLLVGVHGAGKTANGNGAAGLAKWAERGDVIVIGPSFQSQGDRPYQNGDGIHAEKLLKLFKQLGEEYKLKDKMFLHGFSGGSQFTHRFTMYNSNFVCGVSSHSGGSWATDGMGTINSKAKDIPFAISCGEKDTAMSFGGAKYNRLDWYKVFRDEIDKKKFCYIGGIWPGVGHSMCGPAWVNMKQCFQIATGLPGESATQEVAISDDWKNLDNLMGHEAVAKNDDKPRGVPYIDPVKLNKITESAFKTAASETIPDAKLIAFMEKYPPILWQDKPGAKPLLDQCIKAATNWRDAAKKANKFNSTNQSKFEKFTKGLTIPE
jgi:predicted esterase